MVWWVFWVIHTKLKWVGIHPCGQMHWCVSYSTSSHSLDSWQTVTCRGINHLKPPSQYNMWPKFYANWWYEVKEVRYHSVSIQINAFNREKSKWVNLHNIICIFWSKVNISNVNCARATFILDKRVKMSKFLRQHIYIYIYMTKANWHGCCWWRGFNVFITTMVMRTRVSRM